ncbi:hypothetical protein AB7M74_002254 [Bradyrhizobium japonicum]
MRIRRVLLAILLFDRLRDHTSISIGVCKAGASPTGCLGRLGTRVCAALPLMLLLTAFDSPGLAQSGSAAQPTISQAPRSFAGFINEASQRFAIAPNWIRSVQSIESAGDVHARSSKGAMGLMQIMPATWAELRERYNLGNDPYDPHETFWLARPICANCSIGMARLACLPRTTRDHLAMKSISQAALCQTRREHTSQSLQICLPLNCRRGGRPADSHQQPRRFSSRDPIS